MSCLVTFQETLNTSHWRSYLLSRTIYWQKDISMYLLLYKDKLKTVLSFVMIERDCHCLSARYPRTKTAQKIIQWQSVNFKQYTIQTTRAFLLCELNVIFDFCTNDTYTKAILPKVYQNSKNKPLSQTENPYQLIITCQYQSKGCNDTIMP